MASPTQRVLGPDDVAAMVRSSLGQPVGHTEQLTGGGFAAVWKVRLADDRDVVIKVAPPAGVRLLEYEAGLIAAECDYLQRVLGLGVPVPEVVFHGPEWLITTYLPGTALPDLVGVDDAPVRRELGAMVARVHAVRGERFGFTGDRPHGRTWPAAFAAMIESLLRDAVAWDVSLGALPSRIRAALRRHESALAAVTEPSLLHLDLWDGNVLATVNGVARLAGLVDGERFLYGDPLIDFVSPVLFGRMEEQPSHPFVQGYGDVALDERRLGLYRVFLHLLMVVEMPSRDLVADVGRRTLLDRLLDADLTDLGV